MKYNYYPVQEKFLDDLASLKITYKKILQDELKCSVSKNFFKFQDNFYPIKIKFAINVIEKNRPIIGSFNPHNLTITLNYHYYQQLNHLEQLNLIRHELAHYIDYILRGHTGQDHDAYFHQLCLSYGWDKNVYAATIDTSLLQKIEDMDKKVKKTEKGN